MIKITLFCNLVFILNSHQNFILHYFSNLIYEVRVIISAIFYLNYTNIFGKNNFIANFPKTYPFKLVNEIFAGTYKFSFYQYFEFIVQPLYIKLYALNVSQ